jgi:hypothetical protein
MIELHERFDVPNQQEQRRIVIDVYLCHAEAAVAFFRNLIQHRRDHFARFAPGRPEIGEGPGSVGGEDGVSLGLP